MFDLWAEISPEKNRPRKWAKNPKKAHGPSVGKLCVEARFPCFAAGKRELHQLTNSVVNAYLKNEGSVLPANGT